MKILTIDDSSTILKVVEGILIEAGYDALIANGGEEGVKIAQNDRPDAIILDRQMPDMDGNQVLMTLKASEDTKNIPVIMLTSDNRVADVSACFELGAVDYIVKPFDTDNFLVRLKKALRDVEG